MLDFTWQGCYNYVRNVFKTKPSKENVPNVFITPNGVGPKGPQGR